MRRMIILLIIAVLLSGCGIFTPRDDFEDPEKNSYETDLFNFSALMEGTGEKFLNVNPEELLDDEMEYIDVGRSFTRAEIKTKLIQLESQYDTSTIKIRWEKEDNSTFRVGDTIFIYGAVYAVSTLTGELKSWSGVSDFVIARSDRWRIYRWKDIPSGVDKSFFAPSY